MISEDLFAESQTRPISSDQLNQIQYQPQQIEADSDADGVDSDSEDFNQPSLANCLPALRRYFAERLEQTLLLLGGKQEEVKGWRAHIVRRTGGLTLGLIDVYYYYGNRWKKFRSRVEVACFLNLMSSTKNIRGLTREQFHIHAVETREKHLISQQLSITNYHCDEVEYSNDMITLLNPSAATNTVRSSETMEEESLPFLDYKSAKKLYFSFGNIIILDWGKILPEAAFHSTTQLFPLGFRCLRQEHDVTLDRVVDCLCEVDAVYEGSTGISVLRYPSRKGPGGVITGSSNNDIEAKRAAAAADAPPGAQLVPLFRVSVAWQMGDSFVVLPSTGGSTVLQQKESVRVRVYEARSPQQAWQAAMLEGVGIHDESLLSVQLGSGLHSHQYGNTGDGSSEGSRSSQLLMQGGGGDGGSSSSEEEQDSDEQEEEQEEEEEGGARHSNFHHIDGYSEDGDDFIRKRKTMTPINRRHLSRVLKKYENESEEDEEELALRQKIREQRRAYFRVLRAEQSAGMQAAVKPRLSLDTVDSFAEELVMRLIEGMEGTSQCRNYNFIDSRDREAGRKNMLRSYTKAFSKAKNLDRVIRKNAYLAEQLQQLEHKRRRSEEQEHRKRARVEDKELRLVVQAAQKARSAKIKEIEKSINLSKIAMLKNVKKRRDDAKMIAEALCDKEDITRTVAAKSIATVADSSSKSLTKLLDESAAASSSSNNTTTTTTVVLPSLLDQQHHHHRPEPLRCAVLCDGEVFGRIVEVWEYMHSFLMQQQSSIQIFRSKYDTSSSNSAIISDESNRGGIDNSSSSGNSWAAVEVIPSIDKLLSAVRTCDPVYSTVASYTRCLNRCLSRAVEEQHVALDMRLTEATSMLNKVGMVFTAMLMKDYEHIIGVDLLAEQQQQAGTSTASLVRVPVNELTWREITRVVLLSTCCKELGVGEGDISMLIKGKGFNTTPEAMDRKALKLARRRIKFAYAVRSELQESVYGFDAGICARLPAPNTPCYLNSDEAGMMWINLIGSLHQIPDHCGWIIYEIIKAASHAVIAFDEDYNCDDSLRIRSRLLDCLALPSFRMDSAADTKAAALRVLAEEGESDVTVNVCSDETVSERRHSKSGMNNTFPAKSSVTVVTSAAESIDDAILIDTANTAAATTTIDNEHDEDSNDDEEEEEEESDEDDDEEVDGERVSKNKTNTVLDTQKLRNWLQLVYNHSPYMTPLCTFDLLEKQLQEAKRHTDLKKLSCTATASLGLNIASAAAAATTAAEAATTAVAGDSNDDSLLPAVVVAMDVDLGEEIVNNINDVSALADATPAVEDDNNSNVDGSNSGSNSSTVDEDAVRSAATRSPAQFTDVTTDSDVNTLTYTATAAAAAVLVAEADTEQAESLSVAMQRCYIVIRDLMSHAHGGPFCWPVDASILPGYYKAVTQPLSFSEIRAYLVEGHYNDSIFKFYSDVTLVIENAMAYNAESSPVRLSAYKVQIVFERLFYETVLCWDNPLPFQDSCHACKSVHPIEFSKSAVCDRCEGTYHLHCLDPPVLFPPRSEWYCLACVEQKGIPSAHPYKTATVTHPLDSQKLGEVVGMEQIRQTIMFVVDFGKGGRELWDSKKVRTYALEPVDGNKNCGGYGLFYLDDGGNGDNNNESNNGTNAASSNGNSSSNGSSNSSNNGSSSIYTMPSGYDFEDYDRVCGVVRAYTGWGASHYLVPPIIMDEHNLAAKAKSTNNNDLRFSEYRKSVAALGTAVGGVVNDIMGSQEWSIVLSSLLHRALESSNGNLDEGTSSSQPSSLSLEDENLVAQIQEGLAENSLPLSKIRAMLRTATALKVAANNAAALKAATNTTSANSFKSSCTAVSEEDGGNNNSSSVVVAASRLRKRVPVYEDDDDDDEEQEEEWDDQIVAGNENDAVKGATTMNGDVIRAKRTTAQRRQYKINESNSDDDDDDDSEDDLELFDKDGNCLTSSDLSGSSSSMDVVSSPIPVSSPLIDGNAPADDVGVAATVKNMVEDEVVGLVQEEEETCGQESEESWELRLLSRQKGREDALITHMLTWDTLTSLDVDGNKEQEKEFASNPLLMEELGGDFYSTTAVGSIIKSCIVKPGDTLAVADWIEGWETKMSAVQQRYEHEYTYQNNDQLTCVVCGADECFIGSPFVWGQNAQEWEADVAAEAAATTTLEPPSSSSVIDIESTTRLDKTNGSNSYGDGSMTFSSSCLSLAAAFAAGVSASTGIKGFRARNRVMKGIVWLPCDPDEAKIEMEQMKCGAAVRHSLKAGSVRMHECCANFMHFNRQVKQDKSRKSEDQRIVEILSGLVRAKCSPLGVDRDGSFYWVFRDSNALFISSSSSNNNDIVGSGSNNTLAGGHVRSQLLPVTIGDNNEDDATTNVYSNTTTKKKTTRWAVYHTITDISEVIGWLDGNVAGSERTLKRILTLLFPEVVNAATAVTTTNSNKKSSEDDTLSNEILTETDMNIAAAVTINASMSLKTSESLVSIDEAAATSTLLINDDDVERKCSDFTMNDDNIVECNTSGLANTDNSNSISSPPNNNNSPALFGRQTTRVRTRGGGGAFLSSSSGRSSYSEVSLTVSQQRLKKERENAVVTAASNRPALVQRSALLNIYSQEQDYANNIHLINISTRGTNTMPSPRFVKGERILVDTSSSQQHHNHILWEAIVVDVKAVYYNDKYDPIGEIGENSAVTIVSGQNRQHPFLFIPNRSFNACSSTSVFILFYYKVRFCRWSSSSGGVYDGWYEDCRLLTGNNKITLYPTIATTINNNYNNNRSSDISSSSNSNNMNVVTPRYRTTASALASESRQNYIQRMNQTPPEALMSMIAYKYLTAPNRAAACSSGQLPRALPYSDSRSSPVATLRCGLLMIEAALPIGAVDTDSEDRWSEDFAIPWREAVCAASDATSLMQCQIMLEYGIRTAWLKPTGLKMFACLPSRVQSMRYATCGLVAIRLFVLDSSIRYEKLQQQHHSSSHNSTSNNDGSAGNKSRKSTGKSNSGTAGGKSSTSASKASVTGRVKIKKVMFNN